MRLYHGTSAAIGPEIQRDGFAAGSYFHEAREWSLAYASLVAWERGRPEDQPLLFTVKAPARWFEVPDDPRHVQINLQMVAPALRSEVVREWWAPRGLPSFFIHRIEREGLLPWSDVERFAQTVIGPEARSR